MTSIHFKNDFNKLNSKNFKEFNGKLFNLTENFNLFELFTYQQSAQQ